MGLFINYNLFKNPFLITLLFQKNINSFEISFNISIIIILNLRSILETSFVCSA